MARPKKQVSVGAEAFVVMPNNSSAWTNNKMHVLEDTGDAFRLAKSAGGQCAVTAPKELVFATYAAARKCVAEKA